jgi:hypothetical protein
MTKTMAALVVALSLSAISNASAEPNFAVWACAHERMVAKWRHAEPRCGWTVGGYTCRGRMAMRNPRTLSK